MRHHLPAAFLFLYVSFNVLAAANKHTLNIKLGVVALQACNPIIHSKVTANPRPAWATGNPLSKLYSDNFGYQNSFPIGFSLLTGLTL